MDLVDVIGIVMLLSLYVHILSCKCTLYVWITLISVMHAHNLLM